jgi:hypothetical protein
MSGLSKLSRGLTSATLVGLLAAGAVATTVRPGSPPRIAPPCSPDGNCIPNRQTYGVYPTRWRPFPTDTVGITPTKAEEGQGAQGEENIGGPQLPTPAEEGQAGPRPRTSSGAGGEAPIEDAIPGEIPFDAVPAPTLEPGAAPIVPPAGQPGVPPAGQSPPAAAPDPLDPFGSAPPAPPAWMQQSVRGASATLETPASETAPAVFRAPNLESDDAPPALPASLQGVSSVAAPQAWNQQAPAVALAQPARVRPQAIPAMDRRVIPASAQTPLGIQLINPVSAMAVAPSSEGAQQAIYFEASDEVVEATDAVVPAN